jgi:Fe-S-cluster containining protein
MLKNVYSKKSSKGVELNGLCSDQCALVPVTYQELSLIEMAAGKRNIIVSNTCPYLEKGKCTVYEVRPTVCRLWGIVKKMPCEYGCTTIVLSDALEDKIKELAWGKLHIDDLVVLGNIK